MILKKITAHINNEKAFTMIEVLMAIMLVAIIGGVIAGSYISGTTIKSSQDAVIEMQQNIRLSIYLMKRELRLAGTVLDAHWPSSPDIDQTIIQRINTITDPVGDRTAIRFGYMVEGQANTDVNWDGNPDNGWEAQITYSLTPYNPLNPLNTGNLDRNVLLFDGNNVNTSIPVITNSISRVIFSFYNDNGLGTRAWNIAPPIAPAYTVAVGITVIVHSRNIDEKLPAVAQQFQDPFTGTIFTTPADQRRRLMGSTVVNLRNSEYSKI